MDFVVGDKVFLKVAPMNGIIRFPKKSKFNSSGCKNLSYIFQID